MALSHILNAITAETDSTVKSLRSAHANSLQSMEEVHARALEALRSAAAQRKAARLHSLRSRAESRMNMDERHAILREKQGMLHDVYAEALKHLATLPVEDVKHFLEQACGRLPTGGTILPSEPHAALLKKIVGDRHAIGPSFPSAGGFRFMNAAVEIDHSFEFLVEQILKPATEIEAAHRLFPAAS